MRCAPDALGLCTAHTPETGDGSNIVDGDDDLCHVGREARGPGERRPPEDGADLLVGLRLRGPMTTLTAVQALASEALMMSPPPEVARRLRALVEVCVRFRQRRSKRGRRG